MTPVRIIARRWQTPVPAKSAKASAYKSGWGHIVRMLQRELAMLGAKQVIVEMDIDEYDIRNDGWIRSNATPRTPGVRMFFESKHGPLTYETAAWKSWEHNIYAIARTLAAQRAIARDGCVKGDQAYQGWKALPGGGEPVAAAEWESIEAARAFLAQVAGYGLSEIKVGWDLYRLAAKRAHPDAGGSNELMAKVNRAKEYLEKQG